MNDPATWKPSALPPGTAFDDERQPVPVVDHPYFTRPGHTSRTDDATAPEPDTTALDRVQLLREVFTVLETGEPHLMAARLQALKIVHRISSLSIRDAAQKAGCPRTTLHRITRQMGHSFQR